MAAYFVPHKPGSGEGTEYNRRYIDFHFTVRPFTWTWAFSGDSESPKSNFPAVRAIVDGVPMGDFIPSTNGKYDFVIDVPDGQHIIDFEGTGVEVLKKPFSARTGGPLTEAFSYTTASRFERQYNHAPAGAQEKIQYPPSAPKVWPLKQRNVESFSEFPKGLSYIHGRDLWVTTPQTHTHGMMTRDWVETRDGTLKIELDNKYFYNEAVRGNVGIDPPKVTLRDGPRGIGTLGYLYKWEIAPNNSGAYWSDTVGRAGFMWNDGRIVTFAGQRVKEGTHKAPQAYINSDATQAEKDHYASKMEVVGDWSQVTVGPKSFHGLWGFAGIGHEEDPTDGFHEFFYFDALGGRILYANHYTAHSHSNYDLPRFAPPGYVAPNEPTGRVQMFVAASGLKEPWDGVIKKVDGVHWLYFTEFKGNAIKRMRMSGGWEIEDVLLSSKQPNDAGIGIPAPYADSPEPGWRLWNSNWKYEQYEQAGLVIDGPVGVATCIRPQAIALDSQGRVHWVERYTYLLRRLELDGTVKTLSRLVGGSAAFDLAMCIDTGGTFGPKDDIFVRGWWQADERFSIDGVKRPTSFYTITSSQITSGPADWVRAPGYGWAVSVKYGRFLLQGSAAGWQCIEVTKRLPTDPAIDYVKAVRGWGYWNSMGLVLTHGPLGRGRLGYPYVEEIGSWSENTRRDYFRSLGAPEAWVEDMSYAVWAETVQYDYTGAPPPPPPPPPSPVDCELSEWSAWSEWGPSADENVEERRRTRTIVTPSANGGAPCGPTEEIETRTVVVPPGGVTKDEALAALAIAKAYIEGQ